ncbi:cytochrome and DOMON domain-containing protein [Aspergillus undulatus]|uniref:cytochrome and DOMON domain-containing protein n=1 Tax=Aspergillus undulatus TaxID=1810928 RepID=UPI003CCD5FF9
MKIDLWIGAFFPYAWARPAAFHPPDRDDISFRITLSNTTHPADAKTETEILLFQITAPTTIEWVGLAQGTQMKGANMFLLYTASTPGNITVSPRTAPGHVPPEFNPRSRIAVLPGSGVDVDHGVMKTNVECHSCIKGPTNAETHWIWAYKEGEPMDSDDVASPIGYHDAFGGVVVDLSHARTPSSPGEDKDPFTDPDYRAVRSVKSSYPFNGSGDSRQVKATAHGILMSLAFLLLFPLFGIIVPLGSILPIPISITRVHAPLQGFAATVVILGQGLGIVLWTGMGTGSGQSHLAPSLHPILGILVVTCLTLVQPVLGYLQHRYFLRTANKGAYAHAHRWLGRVVILAGVVNGGLGLVWAGAGMRASVAYVLVAGVVFGAYVAVRGGIWYFDRREGSARVRLL